jgi:hypothetical protein
MYLYRLQIKWDKKTRINIHYKKKNSQLSNLQEAVATTFWDCEGFLLCEFIQLKTIINSNKYSESFVKPLKDRGKHEGVCMTSHFSPDSSLIADAEVGRFTPFTI